MAITVKFIGALRHAAGENTQVIDCAECSVKELIDSIICGAEGILDSWQFLKTR